MAPPANPDLEGWLDAPLEERTVLHVLRGAAAAVPDRTAVIDARTQVTYLELYRAACSVAGGLRQLGVAAGDRVLIMMDNHLEHVLAWFGTNLVGAVAVPINTALRGEQLVYVTRHSGSEVVLVDEGYLDRFDRVREQLPDVRHVVVRGDLPESAPRRSLSAFDQLTAAAAITPVELEPWDTLAIMYTSGTTGRSKGVLVTQAQTYGRMWPLRTGAPELGDVTLVTLPIFHVIGQCRGLYNTLIAHGTVVLEERFSASGFWDTCRAHGVTYVPIVGAMASYLLARPAQPDDADNPVQRISIGTTIPEVDAFAARFDVELTTSYGLTEVGGVLVGPARASGCGYIRPDFEARLVDDHDREVLPGATGELVLRNREPWTVMGGYLGNAEATAEKWRNLWLHTGDQMYQREDGEFVFVGRRTESVRRRGENISLMEVEEGVSSHPSVREAAVVGIDHGDELELKAVVVAVDPDVPLDLPALVEHLVLELPYYMVPRFLEVVDELPRTESTHRVQREPLRSSGTENAWDREEAGLVVTRDGLVGRPPTGG